jgi:hypothetical protein
MVSAAVCMMYARQHASFLMKILQQMHLSLPSKVFAEAACHGEGGQVGSGSMSSTNTLYTDASQLA